MMTFSPAFLLRAEQISKKCPYVKYHFVLLLSGGFGS